MNTYRYAFESQCPNNDEMIVYQLEIEHADAVMVEHIKDVCAEWPRGFHENIAADIHKKIGGKVTLRAVHHGVAIKTVLP